MPLAKDMTFARSLDLNAAIRYADYSTSGGVTSWKIGAVYQPIDDFASGPRARATTAAPTSPSSTRASSQSNAAVSDPFRNNETNASLLTRSFGNSKLKAEQSDTYTVGAVYQPSWFQGFSGSVDYYDIAVKNAIQQLGAQAVINGCKLGAADLCNLIYRGTDPSTFINGVGPIVAVDNPFENVGSVRPRASTSRPPIAASSAASRRACRAPSASICWPTMCTT